MKKLTLIAAASLLFAVGCSDSDTDSNSGGDKEITLLKITEGNAEQVLLASLETSTLELDLDFLETDGIQESKNETKSCESGHVKLNVLVSDDLSIENFLFDGSISMDLTFNECVVEGVTHNGSMKQDFEFDRFAPFESSGSTTAKSEFDQLTIETNGVVETLDGDLSVTNDLTQGRMSSSFNLLIPVEGQDKPVRVKTAEAIVVDISNPFDGGIYTGGSWSIEGDEQTSISAIIDADGNGLEYKVNGSAYKLIPWGELESE